MFLSRFFILAIPLISSERFILCRLCRLCILLWIGICFLLDPPLPAVAQTTQFPYKAQVIKQNAYVRSGPGLEYYPTDTLPQGQIVEVYRHDPGGWAAIRPPEGSFSWVLARQVEMGPDGLAKAKEDQVPVVVGSRLKNLQDVVQVYLKQGEEVELLEDDPSESQKSKGVWCKIAPPSGEFRWIFSQDISPLVGDIQSPQDQIARPAGSGSDVAGQLSSGGAATPPAPASGAGTAPGSIAIPPGSGGLSLGEFQQYLRQLELELANRVLADPPRWQLQDLHTRAEALLGQAPDSSSRSEARQLLARIGQFLEVQRQYAHILLAGRLEAPKPLSSPGRVGTGNRAIGSPPLQAPTGATTPVPGAAASTEGISASGQPSQTVRPPQAADRFDAVGRLTRVVSAKPGAPTYALLDERGEVVCYLTPAPGINLHPLEGKWIAVTGVTGLMLEPRAKHVAVKQVALVDPPTNLLR